IDKPFGEAVRDFEIRLLRSALKEARFNQRQAARTLGLTYHQFRGLYRKYGDEL
ncbi:MAG: AAA family ATPase, partial [Deltaproteobacteria bacterium]|nr:AAA family ATPase [Deltaproteobacteria bacterium]